MDKVKRMSCSLLLATFLIFPAVKIQAISKGLIKLKETCDFIFEGEPSELQKRVDDFASDPERSKSYAWEIEGWSNHLDDQFELHGEIGEGGADLNPTRRQLIRTIKNYAAEAGLPPPTLWLKEEVLILENILYFLDLAPKLVLTLPLHPGSFARNEHSLGTLYIKLHLFAYYKTPYRRKALETVVQLIEDPRYIRRLLAEDLRPEMTLQELQPTALRHPYSGMSFHPLGSALCTFKNLFLRILKIKRGAFREPSDELRLLALRGLIGFNHPYYRIVEKIGHLIEQIPNPDRANAPAVFKIDDVVQALERSSQRPSLAEPLRNYAREGVQRFEYKPHLDRIQTLQGLSRYFHALEKTQVNKACPP